MHSDKRHRLGCLSHSLPSFQSRRDQGQWQARTYYSTLITRRQAERAGDSTIIHHNYITALAVTSTLHTRAHTHISPHTLVCLECADVCVCTHTCRLKQTLEMNFQCDAATLLGLPPTLSKTYCLHPHPFLPSTPRPTNIKIHVHTLPHILHGTCRMCVRVRV